MKQRTSPVRVLLIEDDEDDYRLVSELFLELSASRFQLHWVSSYEAILDAVRASDYDVCLLDYRLAGHNGLELFDQMKLLGCTVPVIFLTDQEGYQTTIEAMCAGAADYLTKDQLSAPLLERSIRYAIERKQGQDALQGERNKFMGILESLEDGVYIAGHDHEIQYINPIIEREIGPVGGRKCYDYFELRSDACPRCKMKEVFSGKTIRSQAWHSAHNGRTYESFATPVRNPDGSVSKLEVFRDITEHRQMENALRKSEERYRTLFNKASDAICVTELTPDGDFGKFLEVNDTLCRILGYTREELKNLTIASIVAPECLQDVLSIRDESASEESLITDRIYLAKSGRRVPVEVSTHVFEYKGQTTVLTIARNITERRRSDEVLRQSKLKYERLSKEFDALLNAISDTLVLISPDMKMLWANNLNAYCMGTPVAKVIGQHCHEVFFGLAIPCDACLVAKCFLEGEKQTQVSTTGGRFLDKRAFPIKEDDRVSSVILLITDITEKMSLQAEAMQASHLASLGELAAGIAHEINNPINGIINYAQVLINEYTHGGMETDIAMRIVKEGDRIADIMRSLLAFSREGREDREPTSVGAVLEESLVLTRGQIRKEGIQLVVGLPDDLPEVYANFQRIQQVFVNVINNARYALNDKYPGRHKNKVMEIVGETLTVESREYVRITFFDHGTGIPADKMFILTEPFFSTKPFGKGTGLGLAIAQKIVSDHDGRLAFESVEGEFTKVIIDLPVRGGGNG